MAEIKFNLKVNKIEDYLSNKAKQSVLYRKGQSIHPVACGIAIATIWDMFEDLDYEKKRHWYRIINSVVSENAHEGP